MVCEIVKKNLERKLGRKLTEKEKKEVEEKLHHVEVIEEEVPTIYA